MSARIATSRFAVPREVRRVPDRPLPTVSDPEEAREAFLRHHEAALEGLRWEQEGPPFMRCWVTPSQPCHDLLCELRQRDVEIRRLAIDAARVITFRSRQCRGHLHRWLDLRRFPRGFTGSALPRRACYRASPRLDMHHLHHPKRSFPVFSVSLRVMGRSIETLRVSPCWRNTFAV